MRKIALYMMFPLFAASCSGFLEVEPGTQISIREQFSTREGVYMTVNGMYYYLEDLLSDRYFYFADLIGGNLTFTPDEKDRIIEIPANRSIDQVYNFRDLQDDSDYESFYDNAYDVINQANLIIENTTDHPELTADEIDEIHAEALAVRAFVHYLLTIVYAQNYAYTPDASHPGIVYNDGGLVAGVDYPFRLTVAETYASIKSDFTLALELFGEQQALDYGPSYSYFNPITTSAVFARAALQMNDWETAYRMADTVINHSGIALTPGDQLRSEWEKPDLPLGEVILELSVPRDDEEGVRSTVADHYFYLDSVRYAPFVASGDLLELYDSTDIRGSLFREETIPTSVNGIITDESYYFTSKFQDNAGTLVCRLSEMYLIRAEAAASKFGGSDVQALGDLNVIRERAGLDPVEDPSDLLENIFQERRRELAFEGFLLFDISRYQKDIVRDQGCIADICTLEYPSDYYVLPIPEKSILYNENMVQNEGYEVN